MTQPAGIPLTRDPVFQLNSCIWLVRAAPMTQAAKPALAAHGYTLRALNLTVALSQDVGNKLNDLLKVPRGNPAPDAILQHNGTGNHLLMECKATSFGVESTTCNQAYKMLAAAADLNRALRARGVGAVVYVIDETHAMSQMNTLRELQSRLSEVGVLCAAYGVMGLSLDDIGLWGVLQIENCDNGSPMADMNGPILIHEDTGGDARPLYLIPFDPAAFAEQSEAEREFCSRQLTERVITAALARVGPSDAPATLRLSAEEILRESTYGLSDYWEGNENHQMRVKVVEILYKALHRAPLRDCVAQRRGMYIEVSLADDEEREEAIKLLSRAKVARLAAKVSAPTLPMDSSD